MEVSIQVKTTLSKYFGGQNGKQSIDTMQFSTTECLQWWVFTPVKRHPPQDFGLEMEGWLPQGGPMPWTLR